MEKTPETRILSEAETDIVSGGTSIPGGAYDNSEYWQNELLRYKMGQSSIFG